MTHLPFIAAAYGISAVGIFWLAIGASLRLKSARKRLAVIDPRAQDPRA